MLSHEMGRAALGLSEVVQCVSVRTEPQPLLIRLHTSFLDVLGPRSDDLPAFFLGLAGTFQV